MGKRTIFSTLILAAAAWTVIGCDSSESDTSDGNGDPIPMTTIIYEVAGTYLTCNIVYTGENGDPVDVGEVALDWADSVHVPQNESFLARLSAKCADLLTSGKATLRLMVDGEQRVSGDVSGYGDSTAIQFLVQPQ